MHLYPLIIAAIAKPIPVFPDVPSIMVPPGFKIPLFSASSIIFKAIRSLIEFPGFVVSILAKTVAEISLVMLFNFTKGVLPIVSKILLYHMLQKYRMKTSDLSSNAYLKLNLHLIKFLKFNTDYKQLKNKSYYKIRLIYIFYQANKLKNLAFLRLTSALLTYFAVNLKQNTSRQYPKVDFATLASNTVPLCSS